MYEPVTQTRQDFRTKKSSEQAESILNIANKSAISHSPGSFARVRVKKIGLECDADRQAIKPFEKEMHKLLGGQVIRRREELHLVDFVVKKGQSSRKLDILENKVITQINKKKEIAAVILKDNLANQEMSEM